ncbi:CaiB/BaiF CoA transferase family protein [Szabonella alba]|uniref:CoA transferase n=1 Tax=Szabonella alba TaxID=2804194 RepID=A0A8K0VGH5_9RHOB|nr:CoA transferase [Szabonella alba]MBL4919229.1 CoA transferase [Szabonella alba]
MSEQKSEGALGELRVLDLGNFMAGPMAAMWLGDFGAQVIKVEHPRGDGFRHWGRTKDGHPLLWKMLSRNKRCVTLNLGNPEGQAMLKDLVAQSDVLIENFTPGTMAKWGLGYDELAKVNPRLVMLSISAYGQSGPYADRPGFGTLAEALSGYAHITGEADGPPTLPSFGLADSLAGLTGAYAIMVALESRRRTGKGQHVDVSLCEPLITLLGWQVVEYDQLGVIQNRSGSRLPFSAPRNTYPTADGKWIAMSSSAQSIFERTMQAIGRPDLIEDPRFIDNRTRGLNVEFLDEIITEWTRRHNADEAVAIFVAAQAAAAPIYDVSDVMADPHFQARKVVVPVPDQDLGTIRMQAPAPRLSETPGRINFTGPHLGQHNAEVFAELLGLDAAAVDALRAKSVI